MIDQKMSELSSVFGVSNEIIESYIEREQVDGFFQNALKQNKQIVVYGSSKQGKTSLYKKHLNQDSIISFQCSPTTQLIDLYSYILRQIDVQIPTEASDGTSLSGNAGASLRAKIKIPFLAEAEGGLSGGGEAGKTHQENYRYIEYNLGHAQDIAEILKKMKFDKIVILDNFHYLSEDTQKLFAFDLRIFQDLDIRFIILGIWRERNRLTQFNGDLQDRIVEVAVEPWDPSDLRRVVDRGATILNVDFSSTIDGLIESCFDSVGVLQELCKESCAAAKVQHTSSERVSITKEHVDIAIKAKLDYYASRHMRSIETFVDSPRKKRGDLIPLFIPYYFLRVLFTTEFKSLMNGFKRKELHQLIAKHHHRPEDIRASDMSNFLHKITEYQVNRGIKPPLFDYDRSITTLKIIDSTLYFFLRNCDRNEVLESINPPSEELKKRLEDSARDAAEDDSVE